MCDGPSMRSRLQPVAKVGIADLSHRQGAQGTMDTASKATLENEFGTSVDEEVIQKILEKGNMQASEVSTSSP